MDFKDIKCKNCVNFKNAHFDNKRFGYCKTLTHEIYAVDFREVPLNEDDFVTNEDFGCVRFEKKELK